MPLKQENRLIAIETPLGANALGLRSVTVQEHLSRLFQIEAQLLSEDAKVDFDRVVGHNVTIRLQLDSKTARYFNGFVSRFVQEGTSEGYAQYRATVVPWLWFLTRAADCRIFQDKTVPEIIEEVFKAHGFADYKLSLSTTYPKREYCVQYRETDFNFVSRLMEQEGIYYFFEHENGKHTLVLADSPSAHNPFPNYDKIEFQEFEKGAARREVITDWILDKELQPVAYALSDFDFTKPKTSLRAVASVTRQHGAAHFEVFDYPGEYVETSEGERLANARLEELQTQHETLRGRSRARGLAAGCLFTLTGHPRADQNREYLITGVTLEADAGEFASGGAKGGEEFFTCGFTAIPKDQTFRAPRLTPKPVVQGPQTAIVVGPSGEEIYTDKYGRVKVKFHWDRDPKADQSSSCWIRVAQVWAGKKWGAIYTPRVGQEVIVEFLEGDPDQPIITGRVYNAEAMPPYELPARATVSTLKSNSSKGGQGFNEIRFEDKKGQEQLFIHAERNLDTRVKKESFEWVGDKRHLIVEKDQLDHVKGKRDVRVEGDEALQVDGNAHLTIKGARAIEVGGKLSLTVKGDVAEAFQAAHSEQTSGNYYLKAAGVVIEASSGITLKVGGSSVVVDSAGVTLKGSLIVLDGGAVQICSGPGSPAMAGSAASADAPAAPAEAAEADKAKPGEVESVSASGATRGPGTFGSVTVGGEGEKGAGGAEEKVWYEFQVLDAAGQPVRNEKCKLYLSDGTTRDKRTDGNGRVRLENLAPGISVSLQLTERADAEWDKLRDEEV